jgi:hypothetical protein
MARPTSGGEEAKIGLGEPDGADQHVAGYRHDGENTASFLTNPDSFRG